MGERDERFAVKLRFDFDSLSKNSQTETTLPPPVASDRKDKIAFTNPKRFPLAWPQDDAIGSVE